MRARHANQQIPYIQTFYRELMAEERSKVDAWWHPDMHEGRWTWRMAVSRWFFSELSFL